MNTTGRHLGLLGCLILGTLTAPVGIRAQETGAPPVRAIPGITADDPFPRACVSCHVVLPDGRDVRLSTLVTHWMDGVDSLLLAAAQSAAPAGVRLIGRHPNAMTSLSNIPAGCLSCHAGAATTAPPFSRMMHRIHLVGGGDSVFLSAFQGECTYCHKLDKTSGAWSIPSGPEP